MTESNLAVRFNLFGIQNASGVMSFWIAVFCFTSGILYQRRAIQVFPGELPFPLGGIFIFH